MPDMNLNLSATLNMFRLLVNPSVFLPHVVIGSFNHLPIPLDKTPQFKGRKMDIKAVVLDKDDCFAYPETTGVYPKYKVPTYADM